MNLISQNSPLVLFLDKFEFSHTDLSNIEQGNSTIIPKINLFEFCIRSIEILLIDKIAIVIYDYLKAFIIKILFSNIKTVL